MTLKLAGDRDILKMYPHTENEELLAKDIQNLELELKKNTKMSQGEGQCQNVKSFEFLQALS